MIEKRAKVVPGEFCGQRFDTVATALFPDLSRKKIKVIVDAGGAYLNKKRIKVAKHIVSRGDSVEVFWESDSTSENKNEENAPRKKFIRSFATKELSHEDILFENSDFIVVNKPAGLASQATLTSSTETVIFAVEKLNPKKYSVQNLFLVHRLDKDTSGLLLIARSSQSQKFLEHLFRERKIEKSYEALCFHSPKERVGTISFPIAKNTNRENTYYAMIKSGVKGPQFKAAVTDYRVVQTFEKIDCARIICEPKTGRTHQIRVHLQALGCPILGDRTYSQNILGHSQAQVALRHMLHARTLRFKGSDGTLFQFDAQLPADFLECVKSLEIANR